MNAEQRRRYLRDRLVEVYTSARNAVLKLKSEAKIDGNLYTNKERYDAIVSKQATLKTFDEIEKLSYSREWYSAYHFELDQAQKVYNQELDRLTNNVLDRLEEEKHSVLDRVFLTKTVSDNQGLDVVETFGKALQAMVKEASKEFQATAKTCPLNLQKRHKRLK